VSAQDEAVIARHESGVRRFCRSRTHSPEDGDDAAQDTFIRYLRRSDRHVRNPEAWLITAATFACIDINRRRQRDAKFIAPPRGEQVTTGEDGAGQIADPKSVDPEQLIVEALWITSILRRLSERDRIVITHLYLWGRSLSQLASFLGVSYDNAKMIAHRARRHVRALLTEPQTASSG
jgi:RNA polymerase sigma-70 factor (ECF subfamily)